MKYGEFLTYYIKWHYGRGVKDFLNVWNNYVWFFYNFFSIPLLLKTLFSPWRRMDEKEKTGFHPDIFIQKLFVNGIVRFIGFGLRLFVIVSGVVTILLTLVVGFVLFVAWILLPVVLVNLLAFAVVILFN